MPLPGDAAPAFVYVADLPEPGASGWIEGDERHHLVTVCRAASGESATATDGRGRRARIRIGAIGRRVAFEVESVETVPAGPGVRIACGAPEGARSDWLIEKLAEFGVAAFQPLDTDRARWRWSPARAGRLGRLAVAALKQSRSAHRLDVAAPVSLEEWLRAGAGGEGATRWLADAGGGPPAAFATSGAFTGVAGPAQGLTPGEREALRAAGFTPVALGPGTLRAETAGIALAALWSALSAGGGAGAGGG